MMMPDTPAWQESNRIAERSSLERDAQAKIAERGMSIAWMLKEGYSREYADGLIGQTCWGSRWLEMMEDVIQANIA